MQIGAINNPQNDLLDELRWIAGHGFDYIDLGLEAPAATLEKIDPLEVKSLAADLDLGIILHAASDLPFTHAHSRIRQIALDELRRSIDLTAALDARLLVIPFQHPPTWMGEDAGIALYGQLFDILCRHGQEANVLIAIENSPENKHQLKRLRRIVQQTPQLWVSLNVGHANIGVPKNQTREFLFDMGERLIHMVLSDNDGSADDRLALGAPATGAVNWRREFSSIQSFGYDRTCTLDIGGQRRWLANSRHYLQELWTASTSRT